MSYLKELIDKFYNKTAISNKIKKDRNCNLILVIIY